MFLAATCSWSLVTSASNNHNLRKDKFLKMIVIALCLVIKAEFRVSFELRLLRKNCRIIMLFYCHRFIISAYFVLLCAVARVPSSFIYIQLTPA